MKKSLIAYLAILPAIAMADEDAGFVSGTTFTNVTVGARLDKPTFADGSDAVDYGIGAAYWYAEGDDNTGTFTNRNDIGNDTYSGDRPAKWSDIDTASPVALSIDAQGALVRTIRNCQGEPENVETWDVRSSETDGDGTIYFDSLVNFTAADSAPKPTEGGTDKLIVWLHGDDDNQTTNLMVTAGYIPENDLDSVLPTNFVLSSSVNAGQWCRLTISAEKDTESFEGYATCSFKIWVDGVLQTGTKEGTDETTTSFLSLYKNDGVSEYLLTGVAFKGTGAVDDLTFTTTNPYAGEVVNYFSDDTDDYATFAAAIADGATDLHLLRDYDTANEGEEGSILVDDNITLDVRTYNLTSSAAEAIYVSSGASLTVIGSGSVSSAYVEAEGTLIFGTSETSAPTVSEIKVDDDAIVKYHSDTKPTTELIPSGEKDVAWSDDADEDGYYTVVFTGGSEPEGGIDPESGTIATTVTAGNETDAIVAAKTGITVPAAASEAVTAAQYAEYFTYGAVDNNDGTFTVTITGIAETVKTSVAESAVTQLTDDEVTTVTVPAGLYYKITPSTELPIVPITANVQNGLSTGTAITLVKPGTDAGFYQIQLSPTAIE